MHNHPSGNPRPSEADLRVTRKISEAGRLMQIQHARSHHHGRSGQWSVRLLLIQGGSASSVRGQGAVPCSSRSPTPPKTRTYPRPTGRLVSNWRAAASTAAIFHGALPLAAEKWAPKGTTTRSRKAKKAGKQANVPVVGCLESRPAIQHRTRTPKRSPSWLSWPPWRQPGLLELAPQASEFKRVGKI